MMTDISEDPDARLVRALYHEPVASEMRRHLSDRMLAEMDREVALIIGGGSIDIPSMEGLVRALDNMSEEQAEAMARQIAGVIKRHVTGRLRGLEAERARPQRKSEEEEAR